MTANPFFTSRACETPAEFIAALSPRDPVYASAFPRAWVFRGHSSDDYLLVPTALRNESAALTKLTLFEIKTNPDQVFCERQVLKDFLEISDSVGLHLPEDTQGLRQWLDLSIERITVWPPKEMLALMALAQHHGVPTRLLDWSRHPLKAAWFAAAEAAEKKEEDSGLLSVWALSIELLDMLQGEPKPFIVITTPSAPNAKLRAQEGLFTLAKHLSPNDGAIDRTPFDALLMSSFDRYKVNAPGPWFHRVTLPRRLATGLIYQLAFEGVNRAALFPDFYGVVGAMKDAASWHRADGPGARRMQERLGSVMITHESTIVLKKSDDEAERKGDSTP